MLQIMVTANWIDLDSPVGVIRVFESNGKITAVNIAVKRSSREPAKPSPLLIETRKQLKAYFSGKLTRFNLPVDLNNGTEFQKDVWRQISKIPFGKTMSYVQIAQAIGRPKAARAVGGAVGANPIPLIVGCHRVMGSTGKITGYSGGKGIPTKKWLIKHEHISSTDV